MWHAVRTRPSGHDMNYFCVHQTSNFLCQNSALNRQGSSVGHCRRFLVKIHAVLGPLQTFFGDNTCSTWLSWKAKSCRWRLGQTRTSRMKIYGLYHESTRFFVQIDPRTRHTRQQYLVWSEQLHTESWCWTPSAPFTCTYQSAEGVLPSPGPCRTQNS